MSPRRSAIDILKEIKRFIKTSELTEFHKSAPRNSDWKLDPNTVERLCRLCEFCQTEMPQLEVKEVGASVIINVKKTNQK